MSDAPAEKTPDPKADAPEAAQAPEVAPSPAAASSEAHAAPGAPATSDPKPSRKSKAKPKGSLRRRVLTVLVVLLWVGILLRVAMYIAFPLVVQRVAASYGLDATYERSSLSLTGGDVALWRLQLTPTGSTEPFVTTGYVRGTISPLMLFAGKLEIWRLEADGVNVNLEREANGRMPVLERVLARGASTPPTVTTPAPSRGPEPIDFTLPLRVEGFRLGHVQARIRDRTSSPALDMTVRLDVRVDDAGSPDRPMKFEVAMYCDPLLDILRITGEARTSGADLDANFTANVLGLHLKPLTAYLAPRGIRPVADSIRMSMEGRAHTSAAGLAQAAAQLVDAAGASTRPATSPASAVAKAPTTAQAQPGNAAPGSTVAANIPPHAAKPADAIAGNVKLSDMVIVADGAEAVAFDSVTLDGTRVNSAGATLTSLIIDGVRVNAARSEAGNLRLAGIELAPVPAVPTTRPWSQPAGRASVAASQPAAPAPVASFIASLDALDVRNVRFSMDDRSVVPRTDLVMFVDRLSLEDLVYDPARPDVATTIAVAMRAPGIARDIHLDGSSRPFAQKKYLELKLTADGIAPGTLKPYLASVGLESLLQNATLTATIDAVGGIDSASGRYQADARLGKIVFHDRDDLLRLDDVHFSGVSLDPASGRLRVDAVDLSGPKFSFARNPAGRMEVFGFALKPELRPPREPTPPKDWGVLLSRLDVGRFTWKDVKIDFDDRAVQPATTVHLADAGIEVTDFVLDLLASSDAPSAGKIKAWLAAPGVIERIDARGTVVPQRHAISVDLTAAATGITAAGIAPYLKSIGIEPLLKDGSLTAHAAAALRPKGEHLRGTYSLDGVTYNDGASELAGIDKLLVDGVTVEQPGSYAIERIEIDRPRAALLRDADGTFVAGGLRIRLPAEETEPAAALPGLPTTAPAQLAPQEPASLVANVASLRVNGAAVQWSDKATTRPVNTTVHADLDLKNATVGRQGPPARVNFTLALDDALDKLGGTGQVLLGPDSFGATLSIEAAGVRGTALEPYLQPGARFDLKDGRLSAKLDANIGPAPAGGRTLRLSIDGVNWRDGADGPPLFQLDQLLVTVPRADIPGGVVSVDEVKLSGLEMETSRSADGSLQALGLSIGPEPPPPANAQPASTAPAAQAAVPPPGAAPADNTAPPVAAAPSEPLDRPASATQPAGISAETSAIVARARKTLPLYTLNQLDLNIRRIIYRNIAGAGGEPLVLKDWRLRNVAPVEMLGPDAAGRPPAKFELSGRVDPLVESVLLQFQTSPFSDQPRFVADLTVSGIRGSGLTDVFPALRPYIDGSQLTSGQFKSHLYTQLKIDRREPLDFGFVGRGFQASPLVVSKTQYRAQPDGPVLAALEEVRVEDCRIKPATASARIKSIDLTRPAASVVRQKDGIHALGLVLKESAWTQPPTQPASAIQAAPAPLGAVAPVPPPAIQPTSAAPAAGEILIDKLTVSGVDLQLEDRSVEPPVLVPITSLDMDVRDISSLALSADRPMRFSLSVGAGKVKVARRFKGGMLGAIGDVGAALGGKPAAPARAQFEERELFSEIAANGRVSLYPEPNGWARANVSGLELGAFDGLAHIEGVALSSGTLDLTVDARAHGDGAIDINARPSITDISVSEPPQGPIVRFLALPGLNLETVIGALESTDKSITVPINSSLKPRAGGGYSIEGIGDSVRGSVAPIVTQAVAAAPAKVVGGVTSAIGLDAILGGGEKKPDPPIVVQFAAGSSTLEPQARAQLAALAQRLRGNSELQVTLKHENGRGDVRLAEGRANPDPSDAAAMAAALRRRKLELSRVRADVAAEARVRLATGAADADAAVARLRAIDADIARAEEALDRLYDLLRPGASRQAPRRTRAATLEIGNERLDAVRQALLAQLPAPAPSAAKAQPAGKSPGPPQAAPTVTQRVKSSKPQFNADAQGEGGAVTLTLVRVKK